ncbi:glycosyltransferase family 4 protein [Tritonibacter mobilis]|uniref:glycosyltransferase family 4 protein n=1 Tax=Tritonibacter mobilis TaxID=379347 RepID=UPI000E0DFD70|nr:glycosyltransferase family 4 protein [Tritonibacter mobilis]
MKILVLASYAPSLVNFRGELIRSLVDEGHTVVAAAPDFCKPLRSKLIAMGAIPLQIDLSRNGLSVLGDIRYCMNIYTLIRKHRPDLLFSYTIKPNIWGAFAAAMGGVKSIAMVTGLGAAFTVRDIPQSAKERLAFAVARRLYRWASSLNSKLIFQNPDDLRDFIDTGCLRDPGKAALVDGSGVDLSHFAPEPPVHKPIFLMIARLLRNKGVLEYAAAAEILRARYPDSCFRLVGPLDPGIDGINNANLESWVADGTIEYIGKVDDVRPQLAEAMVYVLPSYREGTPRSVLEAMSMGRAIVTSDAPGCRETIRDGVEGYLVPVGDSQALAAAMERFLRDPELATTMGAKSHERARTKYDVRRINRVMIKLLTGSPQQR